SPTHSLLNSFPTRRSSDLMFQAKVLLGSATPSLESYYNAYQEKYGYTELLERYNNVQLPEIILVDLKEAQKKKKMNGYFSIKLRSEEHTSELQSRENLVCR